MTIAVKSQDIQKAITQKQSYNAVTQFLHGFRFHHAVRLVARFLEAKAAQNQMNTDIYSQPVTVMDIGCGNGRLYGLLKSKFPALCYIGVELNPDKAKEASARLAAQGDQKSVILARSATDPGLFQTYQPDIVMALETLEHIPEKDVFAIIQTIAAAPALSYFMVSVPVEVGPAIWLKNYGSALMGYVRHKEYTAKETLWAGLYKLDKLPRHSTGHKGFDWRWLAQTLRHFMVIKHTHRSPSNAVPAWLAPSILFIAQPDIAKKE